MDDARALASLGGGQGVSRACSSGRDAPKLLLHSRPSDPLARPLRADRGSANGLVLRISRKDPGAGTRNAGVFDAGVRIVSVTRVTHAFRFRQMADYQHTRAAEDPTLAAVSGIAPAPLGERGSDPLSGLPRNRPTDGRLETVMNTTHATRRRSIDPAIAYVSVPKGHAFAMAMPDGPTRDPFHVAARADAALRGRAPSAHADRIEHASSSIGGLIVAPPVSSVTHPADYRAARWKRASPSGDARRRGERTGGVADFAPFADASVPPALADEETATALEALGVSKETADAIVRALESRAVWAHDALLEALPESAAKTAGAASIEKAFPLFAFRFKDGPFRRLWVRRGYDPRVRARDARLQCLEMRLDASWFDEKNAATRGLRNSAARVSRSHRETHGFEALAASATARDRKNPPFATRYPLYQLCDVSLPGVRRTLETFEKRCAQEEGAEKDGDETARDSKKKKKCSATYGFFSRARYNRARACVLAACAAVYRGDDPVRAEAEALEALGAEEEEEDDEDRDGVIDEDADDEEDERDEDEGDERDEDEEERGGEEDEGEEGDTIGDDDDDDRDDAEDGDSDSGGGKRARLSPVTANAVRAVIGGAPSDIETAIRESAGFAAGQEMEVDEYDVFGEDDEEESD